MAAAARVGAVRPAWAIAATLDGVPPEEVVDALDAARLAAWAADTYRGAAREAYTAIAGDLRALAAWAADAWATEEHPRALAAQLEEPQATELGIGPGDVCPAYPRLPWDLAARVASGEPPRALAPGLTAAEAHAWCLAGAPDVSEWLRHRLEVPVAVRGVHVVRWAAACMADARRGALLALEHPDAIDAADVGEGLRAPPRLVADRADARAALAAEGVEQGPPVPWDGRRMRGVRHLRASWQLAREGRTMSHCVAGYASRVARGDAYLFALRAGRHRGTVELSPRGEVVQLQGPANGEPSAVVSRLLGAQLRAWGLPGGDVDWCAEWRQRWRGGV